MPAQLNPNATLRPEESDRSPPSEWLWLRVEP
jgi:hypothetical protein